MSAEAEEPVMVTIADLKQQATEKTPKQLQEEIRNVFGATVDVEVKIAEGDWETTAELDALSMQSQGWSYYHALLVAELVSRIPGDSEASAAEVVSHG